MFCSRMLVTASVLAGCALGCSSGSDAVSAQDAEGVEQEELSRLGTGLRSLAGDRVTRFDDADELVSARRDIYRQYKLDKNKGRALRGGLGTLGDLIRPEEAMTLLAFGNIYVGDALVFSADGLLAKARAKLASLQAQAQDPRASLSAQEPVGQTAQALTGRSWQAEDRQYPYKMIGTSYHDTTWVEGEVGAKTEFQKYREKYWWIGKRWYGLDADHLSVRSIVFKDNSAIGVEQDSDSNDDTVSVTANWCVAKPALGLSCGDILSPYGVHSFHAVDHGSYRFRVETANNVNDGANYNGYGSGYDIAW